jgi:hypothetical protein
MVESLEGQLKVMDQLLAWNSELNPQKFLGKEYKILLVWFKIMHIFWNYLRVNPTDRIKVTPVGKFCLWVRRVYLWSLRIIHSSMEKIRSLAVFWEFLVLVKR